MDRSGIDRCSLCESFIKDHFRFVMSEKGGEEQGSDMKQGILCGDSSEVYYTIFAG